MINAYEDSNWYTWIKLAGKGMPPSDEVKAKVKAYWTEQNELEGMPPSRIARSSSKYLLLVLGFVYQLFQLK
jgi:hypothetical protein